MDEKSDIVKTLKEEEKLGLLNSSTQSNLNQVKQQESVVDDAQESADFIEDDNKKENFNSDEVNYDSLPDNVDALKKQLIELMKKNKDLEKELLEFHERFNSLSEYFEVISDTTIALGEKDLFSDVSDIIFQISPKGRITYINSAVEKIAGYSSSEMIGEHFSKLISKEDWKKFHKNLFSSFDKKDMLKRELNSFETVIISKNGDFVPVEINGKLIQYNVEVMGRKNEIRIQGSIRDISERKRAEEERIRNARNLEEMNKKLQQANEELRAAQEELWLLNQDLEKKVAERTVEIEKLLKHKDEFIGQLGHDLKSPLTPLLGLLPLLEEQEKDPKMKELIKIFDRNVKYMRDLVVKTLQIEKLNSPTTMFVIEDIDLLKTVDKIIEDKQFIFKEKNMDVKNKIPENIVARADSFQLVELFDNLFTNAVKFTPENGTITIDAKKNKGFVTVSVGDTGIGMTSEQIGHIFEEFYKADPARHDLDSSGLGLPICKRIVEKFGGKIWAESAGLGKGSTFYFTLPICCN